MLRWTLYTLIGLGFGVIDWYYLDWLAFDFGRSLTLSPILGIIVLVALNYGIWLVPIIPVVIVESRKATKIKGPVLAGILTWCAAILSYYIYYGILLSLGKLPNMAYLNVFSRKYDGFWLDYWRKLKYLILAQVLEWLPIAIIGGAVLGALAWWIFHRRRKSALEKTPLD
jgi:hypothetical protein